MFRIMMVHQERYRVIPVSVQRFERSLENPAAATVFGSHNHDSLEILFLREGVMEVRLDGQPYRLHAGDAVVVNPYVSHTALFVPDEDERAFYDCLMLEPSQYALGFSQSLFDTLLDEVRQGIMRFAPFWSAQSENTSQLTETLSKIKLLFDTSDDGSAVLEAELMSEIYRLLSLLSASAQKPPIDSSCSRDLAFIRSVGAYVEKNFAGPISGTDLCAELGFSRRNFTRLFRQSFGTTFTDYLREYRIRRAADDFRGSGLPVPEIVAAVGFTDYCYFSRSFKSIIGIPPARYFRKKR